jgi:hypothetical protein
MRKKRLPKSFLPTSGAVQDLFPDSYRVAQLFAEISERLGIDETARIFLDIVRRAQNPRRGRPSKDGGRTEVMKVRIEWLHQIYKANDPNLTRAEFARRLHAEWGIGVTERGAIETVRKIIPRK